MTVVRTFTAAATGQLTAGLSIQRDGGTGLVGRGMYTDNEGQIFVDREGSLIVTDVVFYLAGHSDDALLFRGDGLYDDAHQPDVKIVHITMSAGDAGRTDGWWQTRERALHAALRATQSPGPAQTVQAIVREHRIARTDGPGFSSWTLRLPDGNLDGDGFPSTGRRTLGKLASGSIGTLTAVDNSTVYTGWADLLATVRAICAAERADSSTSSPWINTSDFDRNTNLGDHPDHYATAAAVNAFAGGDGFRRAWWTSYEVRNRPSNLSGFTLASKRFLFDAYGWSTGTSPNETEWSWWGARRYERLQP